MTFLHESKVVVHEHKSEVIDINNPSRDCFWIFLHYFIIIPFKWHKYWSFLNSQILVFFFQVWFLDEFSVEDHAVSVFFLLNGGTNAPWGKMTTRLKGFLLWEVGGKVADAVDISEESNWSTGGHSRVWLAWRLWAAICTRARRSLIVFQVT